MHTRVQEALHHTSASRIVVFFLAGHPRSVFPPPPHDVRRLPRIVHFKDREGGRHLGVEHITLDGAHLELSKLWPLVECRAVVPPVLVPTQLRAPLKGCL